MSYADDPQFREWVQRVQKDLIPKIEASNVVISICPSGDTDVKFAVELGLSIMFDKPILVVVEPGTKVPEHLVRVADYIVEADFQSVEGRERTGEALKKFMDQHP